MIAHISKRARSSTTTYSMSNVSGYIPSPFLFAFSFLRKLFDSLLCCFFVIWLLQKTGKVSIGSRKALEALLADPMIPSHFVPGWNRTGQKRSIPQYTQLVWPTFSGCQSLGHSVDLLQLDLGDCGPCLVALAVSPIAPIATSLEGRNR